MKETGMSVVITSINNIIAFMAGTLLPIPALKSFCSQVSLFSLDQLFITFKISCLFYSNISFKISFFP